MPTLAELTELQTRAFHDADAAYKASEYDKAKQYAEEIEKRNVEIATARDAERMLKDLQRGWNEPVNSLPGTPIEEQQTRLEAETRGARTDANYKPRGWAYDMETREALGPAIQTPWVQARMGSNLREEAATYVDVFDRWFRAKSETRGIGAFFQDASAAEVRIMKANYDKSEGAYYIPEFLRAPANFARRWNEIRAMGENTDVAGGYFVPEQFVAMPLHDPGVPGGIIRPRCRVITTTLRDGYLPTFGSVVWAPMSEGGTYGDNTPATGQVSWTVRKSGGQVLLSAELLEDSGIPLPQMISQIFTESKGRWEDQQIIAGDGTSTLEGLRTSLGTSTYSSIFAAPTSIAATDIINAYWALPSQHRGNASWYLTSSLMQQIESIGATSAGIHFMGDIENVNLGQAPDTMLRGKAVDLFDGTGWDDAVAIAANEQLGCIGNFNQYILVDRVGMTLKRDDSINVKSDQVWYGARMREDGRVGIQNAFRILQAHS